MENQTAKSDPPRDALRPLPFHESVVAYLMLQETELWEWFASNQVRQEHAEQARLELLKSTYRIEPATQPRLYEVAQQVLDELRLTAPITFYQASNPVGLNASLVYLPREAHVVLVGSIASTLAEAELKALLGHELAHFDFFDRQENEFLVAAEILAALSNDSAARPCHRETERLYRLYTEIFADRGALLVTGDPLVVISKLLKTETGLAEVSAASYLRQAEEILGKGPVKATRLTHPETFIRAKAIHLFAEKGETANAEIQELIEGATSLPELDLLKQQELAATTQKLIGHFLAPGWFQTETVLAHARAFFPEFAAISTVALEEATATWITRTDRSVQDYFCYVLLDFVAVDRQLEETPLAAALLLTERLGLRERFGELALKELALPKKRLTTIERDAAKILDRANQSPAKT
jgi:hypothetical protein